jgi:hypothetical protein
MAPRYKKGQTAIAPNPKFPWPVKPEVSWAQNYQFTQSLETSLIFVMNDSNHKNVTTDVGGGTKRVKEVNESRVQLCTSNKNNAVMKQGKLGNRDEKENKPA